MWPLTAREPRAKRLILVRHGTPQVSAGTPPAEWPLSAHGRARAQQLARQLAPVSTRAVYSSTEPKAMETARAVADVLGVPFSVAPGLHEHERRGTPLLAPDVFEASIRQLFALPSECVFGTESADAAAARFSGAVSSIVEAAAADDLIVVTHGTVMALFLASRAAVDPFSLWRSLPMPCAAIVRLPELELDRIVAPE